MKDGCQPAAMILTLRGEERRFLSCHDLNDFSGKGTEDEGRPTGNMVLSSYCRY